MADRPVTPSDAAFSMFTGAVVILFLVLLTGWIIKLRNKKYGFFDMMRGNDGYPSLSRFQFLLWTLAILFSYLSVYLTRINCGCLQVMTDIDPALFALMGISVATPLASGYLSTVKYGEVTIPSESDGEKDGRKREEAMASKDIKDKGFSTMLMEGGRPSLTRFQMFSWTLVGVIIYLATVMRILYGAAMPTDAVLPPIDPTLVVLMGISQGVYVGGKALMPNSLEVAQVVPVEGAWRDDVTLIGYDFTDDKGMVFFGGRKLKEAEIDSWDSSTIEFKVPKDVIGPDVQIVVKAGARTSRPVAFKIVS
ncbi:IPT/TIG domain-containing protein [Candidatus Bathyarchaeota archaeon]|nr:IPT/TIG domain-containing protein [Candidatus Bathyarchaeota archaeon]